MIHIQKLHTRQGSIIIVTLILLLVMTTMGVGLYYSTKHTIKQVSISGNRSEALYSSESCIVKAAQWLEIEAEKGTPPCQNSGSSVCKTISAKMNDSNWALSSETTAQKARAGNNKSTCEVFLLGTSSSSAGSGAGFDVGESGYGGGGSTSTKYLYRINSKTSGANNVDNIIEVIASMIF